MSEALLHKVLHKHFMRQINNMKSKKERTLRVVEEKNRRNRKRLEDIKPFVKSAKENLLKASKILDQIH